MSHGRWHFLTGRLSAVFPDGHSLSAPLPAQAFIPSFSVASHAEEAHGRAGERATGVLR
ncbi:hypothetical protein SCOCK_80181 [Actinacidiphila cocklensis]|uniref:Uncharacterized protein n=1 Tax=Actinacidiphila cocklensis TaxID=887465 RepID=A0A9W4GW89_9ACTN|nr:hypothetical protein SCOCK_80181 [Actinacidiphila cocklensis]